LYVDLLVVSGPVEELQLMIEVEVDGGVRGLRIASLPSSSTRAVKVKAQVNVNREIPRDRLEARSRRAGGAGVRGKVRTSRCVALM
jgi:hypothetical protein